MKFRGIVQTALLLALYAAWNVIAVLGSQSQESFDTYRYFGLIFDVQNPGFTTTALFVMVQDPQTIMFVLVLISVVVWSALALAILERLRGTWVRWPLAAMVLVFSMSTPIWSYNTVLLTESLTVSTFVLWLAAIVWTSDSRNGRSWWQLIALAISGGLAILTRPQLLIIIVPAHIVILLWIARRNREIKPALTSGFLLLPFVAVGLIRIYQLATVQLYQFRYALNNLVDKGSSFRPYALENMPPCEPIQTALNGPAPWNDIHALESTLVSQCPETWMWFNSGSIRFQEWFLANPSAAINDYLGSMSRVNLAVMSDGRAMPQWLSDTVLNPTQPWLWMFGYFVLGVFVAIFVKARLKVSIAGIAGVTMIVVAVATFLLVMWGSDGYDINRHIYPVLPLMGIAVLIFPSTIPERSINEVSDSKNHLSAIGADHKE